MKFLHAFASSTALCTALCACASTPRDRSADFARALVGQWEYDHDDPECPGHSYEAYRSNGTYTVTSDGCDLTSDGFGIFRYGWYVAREHLCSVHVEEQYSDTVKRPRLYREKFLAMAKEGFVEARCFEKIVGITPRTITLQKPDGRTVTMKRSAWR
jgi:hypothetical protein